VLPICNVRLVTKKPSYLPLPPVNDKSLGAELKRRRLTLEWTQQRCSSYFDVLKDSYQRWEWNQRIPTIEKRKRTNEFLEFNFWDDKTGSLANRTMLYRIEHGITRARLGVISEVSDSSIERLEKGQGSISNSLRFKLEMTINSMSKIEEK